MAPKKRKILQKRMRVIVGEGPTEKAFLLHLRQFFHDGKVKVTVKTANGKGPDNIINDAIGTYKASAKNVEVVALLDEDIKWPSKLVTEARSLNIDLVGVYPCIEAVMLDILSIKKPNPCNNNTCKKLMHPRLNNKPTNKESYSKEFTEAVINSSITRVEKLQEIKKLFQS